VARHSTHYLQVVRTNMTDRQTELVERPAFNVKHAWMNRYGYPYGMERDRAGDKIVLTRGKHSAVVNETRIEEALFTQTNCSDDVEIYGAVVSFDCFLGR
jgi:hypothetical protein